MALARFLVLFCCILLPVVTLAQDVDNPWFWMVADSVTSSVPCPGRCLAVNDSGQGEYVNKPVVFVACKGAASSSDGSSSSSDSNNNNQQWLQVSNAREVEIKFNATAATDGQSTILCLQPDPATSNRTLKVAECTKSVNQKWIVANNTIASRAFDPPRYLAMRYRLAGFLNDSDGPLGWREATILPSTAPHNNSFTTTFSMIDSSQDLRQPPAPPGTQSPESRNFIRNGGFEQSSYDFPNQTAEFPMNENDPFSLCNWQVMKSAASLRGGPNPAPSEGNRSLYLKEGIVKQNADTTAGAFYTLVFKVARDNSPPSASYSSDQNTCNNSDTLSVNPYPSSNVHMDLEVRNVTWTTKHVSFQAVGNQVQLAFQGCAACGCYLDDVNLVQVLGRVPFPPPPLWPAPPGRPAPGGENREPPSTFPDGGLQIPHSSSRLSNVAVVGIVVGAAALFFVIGAACVGVVVVNKKEERKESEIGMGRPREWSIHTTTPPQSQQGGRGTSSSNATVSAATLPAAGFASVAGETSPLSASNPQSHSGP